MRYIVEGRARGQWVAIGHPYVERARADAAVDAALESNFYEDTRILVVNKERQVVQIIQ